MKSILRSVFASLLNALARAILRQYRPSIVMVTGSVGKTSTKDAIAAALSRSFYLRASEKSYNSEIGVPLTIIGASTPWANPLAWFKVFGEGLLLLALPAHYPKLLILEVGADHPGDMARILRTASPSVVVVTRLPEVPVHVEAYADPAEVREEEFAPAYALPHGAPLIISADDEYARTLKAGVHAAVTYYGYDAHADARISNAAFAAVGKEAGMHATLHMGGEEFTIQAPGVLGRHQLYAPAAALATAEALGVSAKEALRGLKSYMPPPGRARILLGANGSLLIDDTYNASPAATEEALESLGLVKGKRRRIAVLGDMLELGRYSAGEHERIGRVAAEKADLLATVGPRARAMADAAKLAGMPEESVHAYGSSEEAAEALDQTIEEGDLVLVKGSQSVRMERVVERLLADQADIGKLARQDKEWKRR
ncbi:MAG TPA: UDP-N-acetylmuramoyl-tripeptide--D-alanyl-D-alanine ligase [Candidatus Paceibacterota bacterium]|nr:UDP-N-acetylmuramoyl-tripeptide--D-alanyl-D-alanine ligase [Candidatus Paceibacterota bacterium]